MHGGATRRRWVATVCACAWLLYVLATAFAPPPALAAAHQDAPPWAADLCSQAHGAAQEPAAPDQPACAHDLCCLLGCALHHGAAAAPCPPVPPAAAAARAPGFARTDPAQLPGTMHALLPGPRGPPDTAG